MHMLLIFKHNTGLYQVWDTNNQHGFVTHDDIKAFLQGTCSPIPY